MRTNSTRAVFLLIALVGAVIVVAGVALREGDKGGPTLAVNPDATYTPPALPDPPTPTATPPGPTPPPLPQARAEAFELEQAPGPIDYVPYTPGDRITKGVYFVDAVAATAKGIGTLSHDPLRTNGNRLYAFYGGTRVLPSGEEIPPDGMLIDRQTGATYAWRLANLVALGEGKVLFRIPDAGADDWFLLIDLDKGLHVAKRFRAEARAGLISPDGSRAAVWGSNLYLVNLETAALTQLPERLIEDGDRTGFIARNTDEGTGFLIASAYVDRPWVHYTWNGDLILTGTGQAALASPSGDLLGLVDSAGPQALTYNFIDTHSGKPVFRVTGVDHPYWYDGANRWLADESGIVVQDPSGPRKGGLVLAMRDGRVIPFVGVPAPDPTGLLHLDNWATDPDGNILTQAVLPDGTIKPLQGWQPDAPEVVVTPLQRCCHGPNRTAQVITTYAEAAPYLGRPMVRLKDDMLGAEVLDAPGTGSVLGRLQTTLVEIRELTSPDSVREDYARVCEFYNEHVDATSNVSVKCEGEPIYYEPLEPTWAHVVTSDGQEGWVLVFVLYAAL